MTVIVYQDGIPRPAKDLQKQVLLPEDLYKYFMPGPDKIEYHILIGKIILYYNSLGQEYLVSKMVPGDMIWLDRDFYGDLGHTLHWHEIDWNGFKIIDSDLCPYRETDMTK